MSLSASALLLLFLVLAVAVAAAQRFEPFNVSYDHRALLLGGRRRMLISAGLHYPRATAQMWPSLIAKCKEAGVDVIETYVFWSGHEPTRGQYFFEERYDLVKFIKLVAAEDLFLLLRIGPFVCAEWNFGGLPVWLRDLSGIQFRTDNTPFKEEMQRFVVKITDMMKAEKLFAWQGGPIILLQIENEYGNVERYYGRGGKDYVQWVSKMALGLGVGLPWVMCNQPDAPGVIINSCNAFYCDGFKPNSKDKPVIWTEDYPGWFASWGGRLPHRPVRDNAFAVARFFERGGSFQNYYMFFGGTNFERTAGGPLQITSYDYDAPIDEYGILSQPKWGHLKDLHAAIRLCEPALVAADSPQYKKLGHKLEAHIYADGIISTNTNNSAGVTVCSAFLSNTHVRKSATVKIFGNDYYLPPWSVSILPDCDNVAFNTAKVRAQISVKIMAPVPLDYVNSTKPDGLLRYGQYFDSSGAWCTSKEPIGLWTDDHFSAPCVQDHLKVTKDKSDYLWYFCRVNISKEDVIFWEANGIGPTLIIDNTRDVLRIFMNGQLAGSKVGNWVTVRQPVKLAQGTNELALLSETVGLKDYGPFMEKDGAGIKGKIVLTGLKHGNIDLSGCMWTYQVGLKGENYAYYSPKNQELVDWTELVMENIQVPFMWYKILFNAPQGTDPVALDLGSMGKGQAWVNGHGIGRYWTLVAPKSGCPKVCDYRGTYDSTKCRTSCGEPSQRWYHIPREWLQATNNLLVLFEETGGDPLKISLGLRYTHTVCASISERDYPPLSAWLQLRQTGNAAVNEVAPEMELQCDDGHAISQITFASYGDSTGSCQKFSLGKCHALNSSTVVAEACEGKNRCRITVSNVVFGDPCPGVEKSLVVQAECSSPFQSTQLMDDEK